MMKLLTLTLLSCLSAIPFETRRDASTFLKSRKRRANAGLLEELQQGNLQQECIDEVCNYEEAREVFETDVAGLEKWWESKHKISVKKDQTGLIVGIVVGVLVFLIIVVVTVAARKGMHSKTEKYRYPRTAPPPYSVAQGHIHTGHSSIPQIHIADARLRIAVSNCYLDRNRVKLGSKIKEGNFGVVYKAEWTLDSGDKKVVAAKTLKKIETERELQNFLREGVMMSEFDHKNVLKIYGVCTSPGEYPIIILPFMKHGDLRGYLRNGNHQLTVIELIGFCHDVCAGMEHLAASNFVHRDLAARNVLVGDIDLEIERNSIKIGDFGLSRDLHSSDYYRSNQKSELPLKWMAPEAIERSIYSEKSDVWAFGVTAWEVMTRAISPYATVDAIYIMDHLKAGNRMNKPSQCPERLYEIIKTCWHMKPEKRPTFSNLFQRISNIYIERKRQLDQQRSIAENRNNRVDELGSLSTTGSFRVQVNDYSLEPTI